MANWQTDALAICIQEHATQQSGPCGVLMSPIHILMNKIPTHLIVGTRYFIQQKVACSQNWGN